MRNVLLLFALSVASLPVLADVPPCECTTDADCKGNSMGESCQRGCYCGEAPEEPAEPAELPKQKTEEPQSCGHTTRGEDSTAGAFAFMGLAVLAFRRRG